MSTPQQPIILYWDAISGHSHRVQLFLELTGLPYEIRQVQLAKGEHKQPEYLAINPLGKLPAIDHSGTIVYDSNAILVYLATKYDAARAWLPSDPIALSEVIRYLSFAAGPIEYGPSDARLLNLTGGDPKIIEIVSASNVDKALAIRIAETWLPRLDKELARKTFLAGDKPTIADVANYTYVAHAPEGDISLDPYPNLRAWIARVEALPGFVPMQPVPIGLRKAA